MWLRRTHSHASIAAPSTSEGEGHAEGVDRAQPRGPGARRDPALGRSAKRRATPQRAALPGFVRQDLRRRDQERVGAEHGRRRPTRPRPAWLQRRCLRVQAVRLHRALGLLRLLAPAVLPKRRRRRGRRARPGAADGGRQPGGAGRLTRGRRGLHRQVRPARRPRHRRGRAAGLRRVPHRSGGRRQARAGPVGRHPPGRAHRGDAWIVDVTDPTDPAFVSSFGIHKDLGLNPALGQGCSATAFGHGMDPSEDGRTLFVSYWDAGFISLDISNPGQPRFLGRFSYQPNQDGDAHSTSYDDQRKLLFTADEDFCKTSFGTGTVPGWGYMRVLDESDPAHPVQIGEFHTPNSFGLADPGAGDYVIHNPLVVGTDVYLSWYTDGVRVVSTNDPRNPTEVAYFVPPAAQNPVKPAQRNTLTNTTQVWGVAYEPSTRLVYASDMNSGLWILKRTK